MWGSVLENDKYTALIISVSSEKNMPFVDVKNIFSLIMPKVKVVFLKNINVTLCKCMFCVSVCISFHSLLPYFFSHGHSFRLSCSLWLVYTICCPWNLVHQKSIQFTDKFMATTEGRQTKCKQIQYVWIYQNKGYIYLGGGEGRGWALTDLSASAFRSFW